jgi:hypothetical protein
LLSRLLHVSVTNGSHFESLGYFPGLFIMCVDSCFSCLHQLLLLRLYGGIRLTCLHERDDRVCHMGQEVSFAYAEKSNRRLESDVPSRAQSMYLPPYAELRLVPQAAMRPCSIDQTSGCESHTSIGVCPFFCGKVIANGSISKQRGSMLYGPRANNKPMLAMTRVEPTRMRLTSQNPREPFQHTKSGALLIAQQPSNGSSRYACSEIR